MGSVEFPQLANSTELLNTKSEPKLVAEFLNSAVYSGLESPIRAMVQIVDQHAKTELDAKVKSGFKALGVEAPEPAKFNTSNWYAQQAGGAVGMMLPFFAVRSGVQASIGNFVAEKTLVAGGTSLTRFALNEAVLAGATGLAYGTLLTPTKESNVGTTAFYGDRLKHGVADMTSFAAMGFMAPYIGKGISAIAAPLDSVAMNSATRNILDATIKGPILPGVLSGAPNGFVGAQINAWKDGRYYASAEEVKESVVGMSFVGGALGAANWLANKTSGTRLNEASIDPEAVRKAIARLQEEMRASGVTPEGQGKISPALEAKVAAATSRVSGNGGSDLATQRLMRELGLAETGPGQSSKATLKASSSEQAINAPSQTQRANARLFDDGKQLKPADASKPAEGSTTRAAVEQTSKPGDTAKFASDKITAKEQLPPFEVVLGASGVEAPAHIGFLRALEESRVPIGKIMGASGGALVATFYANGYKAADLNKILLSNEFRYPSASTLAKCFHLTDPWNLFPHTIDFKPFLQEVINKYDLKPQPNLRIVAADASTKKPFVFEGTNYDLATALAASTAAVTIGMKPVSYNGRQLIDGVYYHPIPADLATAPALVSKIGFASKFPSQPLTPWDFVMHMREMMLSSYLNSKFPDPKGHIIAETGMKDLSTNSWGVGTETLNKLIEHGYDSTKLRLKQSDALDALKKRSGEGKQK
ncbi:MAG: patatin-like phospholipase family protein [Candidatus Obscuribacterales bacterium]|jgi:hypothetical protein|nr:patatin-like phospholipase family protein [Candidatus Obscuribacterales bacterium]